MSRLALLLILAAVPARAADLSAAPPKVTFTTGKAQVDVAGCLAPKLTWLATPSVVQGRNGASTLLLTNFGREFARVDVLSGSPTIVELRGASGGRVRRSIQACL